MRMMIGCEVLLPFVMCFPSISPDGAWLQVLQNLSRAVAADCCSPSSLFCSRAPKCYEHKKWGKNLKIQDGCQAALGQFPMLRAVSQ